MIITKIEKVNNIIAKELFLIEKECFLKPWSINAFLESQNTVFYVCYINKKAVGYMGLLKVLNECYITNIAVLKNYRNKKIATNLLNAAINDNISAEFITLEVRKSNFKAINLYKKFGFLLAGERKNFYTSPKEDAFIFTKTLNGE